jgi:hypothetical protein
MPAMLLAAGRTSPVHTNLPAALVLICVFVAVAVWAIRRLRSERRR